MRHARNAVPACILILAATMARGGPVTVQAEPNDAQVTIACDMPTLNTDGTPLTDLAGVKAYYGTTSGEYAHHIDAGMADTFSVTGLVEGATYFLACTAYKTSGLESAFSAEVSGIAKDVTPVRCEEVVLRILPETREVEKIKVGEDGFWDFSTVTQTNWHDDVWVDVQAGERE